MRGRKLREQIWYIRKTVNCNSAAMNKTRLRHDKYKLHFYTADFTEDFNAPNRSETSYVVSKHNVDKTNNKLMAA
jgi:hypothetical protein